MKLEYNVELNTLELLDHDSKEVNYFLVAGHPNVWVPDFDTEKYIGPTEYSCGLAEFLTANFGVVNTAGDIWFDSYNPETNLYTFGMQGYDLEVTDANHPNLLEHSGFDEFIMVDEDGTPLDFDCKVEGYIVKDDQNRVYLLATSLEFDESFGTEGKNWWLDVEEFADIKI